MANGLKCRGIVLNEFPMGDKDKRITLLTREYGKIGVMVKGAFSPNSKWRSVSQPFSCASYELSKSNGFYYIKDAELIDSFYAMRSDFDRLAWGELLLEVSADIATSGEDNSEIVDLLLRALSVMRNERMTPQCAGAAFLWRLMSRIGFQANLRHCAGCGAELTALPPEASQNFCFSFTGGAMICPDCAMLRGGDYFLSRDALNALLYIQEAPAEKVFSFSVGEDAEKEMAELACRYLEFHLGGNYRGLKFIRNALNND